MSAPYYADDAVTLYHGDCREVAEWLDADVLVTDPPYGVAWREGWLHSTRGVRKNAVQSIVSDEDTSARDAVLAAWGPKPAVVFGTWRRPRPEQVTHRLIWHKRGRHPGVNPAPFFPNDEEIYLLRGGWSGAPTPTVLTTCEQRAAQPNLIGHPTPKPVSLMQALVVKCSPGVIADPFAGSGATLLAARLQGRKAIGVEIEEAYCELIVRRLSQEALDFTASAS